MGLEGDAILVEFAQAGERHHLEAAGIGQDRAGPIHHLVQPAQRRHPLGARAQHQMVGVGEDEFRPGRAHRIGHHRLDGAGGADRHEHRRRHVAMRGVQRAETGLAVGGLASPGQAHPRASDARSSSEESP